MPAILNIISDELNRLERLKVALSKKISTFPKGSIRLKTQHQKVYAYLKYRQGNKVIDKYLGLKDSELVKQTKKKIEERRQLQARLKKIVSDIREINRAVKIRK